MRARFPLSIARAIRVDPEKKTARVQEMMGRSVSKQAVAEKFKQYFDEAMSTPRP